jgi:membrane associated rhomboid family serine protease
MIPFQDDNPGNSTPVVTIVLIAINVVVFLYEQLLLSNGQLEPFIYQAALIPVEVTRNFGLAVIGDFFTSMFMHGDWMHLIGNMLYLWVFGDNIEDTLGHIPYLFFYLVCGLLATFTHIATGPFSDVPTLGASGAISGVLGAYLVLFPHAYVRTLVFLFRFIRVTTLRALWVLGFWFVYQLVLGLFSLGSTGGGVAFWAHIGGFVAGFGLMFAYASMRGLPKISQYDFTISQW